MYDSFLTRIAVCLSFLQGAGLGFDTPKACQAGEPVQQAESEAGEAPVEKVYREIFIKDCVISFTASWCPPCRWQHAENKVLKDKKIRLWEIDIDQHPRLWAHFAVLDVVPSTYIIKKGKVVNSWAGFIDHKTVEDAFNKK